MRQWRRACAESGGQTNHPRTRTRVTSSARRPWWPASRALGNDDSVWSAPERCPTARCPSPQRSYSANGGQSGRSAKMSSNESESGSVARLAARGDPRCGCPSEGETGGSEPCDPVRRSATGEPGNGLWPDESQGEPKGSCCGGASASASASGRAGRPRSLARGPRTTTSDHRTRPTEWSPYGPA